MIEILINIYLKVLESLKILKLNIINIDSTLTLALLPNVFKIKIN